MTKFEWLDIFELGVPEIDNDHKKLFALAKHLGPVVFDANHVKCLSTVEEFIALAQEHFRREEAILRRLGYPELNAHVKYHAKMIDGAKNLKRACQKMKGKHELEECYRLMTAFLIDDIIRGDFTFKSFLQTKGYGGGEPGHAAVKPAKRGRAGNG